MKKVRILLIVIVAILVLLPEVIKAVQTKHFDPPIGEQAALLGEYIAQMPGNECFKIDDISSEEFLPESVSDENFVMFIRVVDETGYPVPSLVCQTNANSYLGSALYFTDAEGYCQVLAPKKGTIGIKLHDRYAKEGAKKINSAKWRIERLTDNEDVLLTLKWDGTRPYESINAQQNRLIVTVVDSERVPIVNMPVQCITQDSYLYRANEVPAAPVVPSLTDTDGRIIITGIIPAPLKAYQLIVGNKNIYGNVWRKDFRYWGGEQSVTIVVE